MLGYLYGIVVGDWAIGSGWIARAQHLLEGVADSSERGWVELTLGMFERDRSVRHHGDAAGAARLPRAASRPGKVS